MILDEMPRSNAVIQTSKRLTGIAHAAADGGFVGHYVVLVAYDARQDIFQVSDPGVAAGVRAAQRVRRWMVEGGIRRSVFMVQGRIGGPSANQRHNKIAAPCLQGGEIGCA